MDRDPSDGELLLCTFHGRCGHRRQEGLPCATPRCKQGPPTLDEDSCSREGATAQLVLYGEDGEGLALERAAVRFGDEVHYVWRKIR